MGKSVANGKNLIGDVVGGNQNSTFQVLANNAQNIKTQRDQYASQVTSLNGQVSNLNSQVSGLNTQITSMTKDRDNWKNIANSKRAKITKEVVHPSHVYLPVKLKTSETFIVEILNGSSNVGTLQLVMLSDRLRMVAIHRGNTNKSSGEWNKGSGSHSGLGFSSGITIDVDIPSYDGSFTLDFYLSGYWISKHIIQYLQQ